jgi:hypothetical protein
MEEAAIERCWRCDLPVWPPHNPCGEVCMCAPRVAKQVRIWPNLDPFYSNEEIEAAKLIQSHVRRFLACRLCLILRTYRFAQVVRPPTARVLPLLEVEHFTCGELCAVCVLPEYVTDSRILHGIDLPKPLLENDGGTCQLCSERVCSEHLDEDDVCVECEFYK